MDDQYQTPISWGNLNTGGGRTAIGDGKVNTRVYFQDPPASAPFSRWLIVDNVDVGKVNKILSNPKDWEVSASMVGSAQEKEDFGGDNLNCNISASGKFFRLSVLKFSSNPINEDLSSSNKQPQEILFRKGLDRYRSSTGTTVHNYFARSYDVALSAGSVSGGLSGTVTVDDEDGTQSGDATYSFAFTGSETFINAGINIVLERVYFKPSGTCAIMVSMVAFVSGLQFSTSEIGTYITDGQLNVLGGTTNFELYDTSFDSLESGSMTVNFDIVGIEDWDY